MSEPIPTLPSSSRQSYPPGRTASLASENPDIFVDVKTTTPEPKSEKTDLEATNEALVKSLQEMIACQAALIKTLGQSNTQNSMNSYTQAFANSALMGTFLATLTVSMMSYIHDAHEDTAELEETSWTPENFLWLFSLTVEVWATFVATIYPMVLGGCMGRRLRRLMSSEVALRTALISVGYFLCAGSVFTLTIAWNWFLKDDFVTSYKWGVAFVVGSLVLYPGVVFFISWVQARIFCRVFSTNEVVSSP